MNSKHSIASVIAALFIFLVCASRPAHAAPPSDPCSLLTQPQVSAALGVQVGEAKRLAPKACEWSVPGAPELDLKKVTVTLQDPQAFAFAKMPAGHGITKSSVGGLGDDAVFGVTPHFAATLTVKKGDVVFVVHVYGFPLDPGKPLDQIQAMEKTLALQVLSKL